MSERSILLCYDGSPQSVHAIAVAARLFPGARAHVLNVWTPVEWIIARYGGLGEGFMGEELSRADADLEAEAAKLAAAGVESATQAGLSAVAHTAECRGTGHVWQAALETADTLDADVIVTGMRSLRGLHEVIANTLSHALIQHSPRPVLAIPAPVSETDR